MSQGRCTVDEYHRLIAKGMFERKTRHELLDGLIVSKPTPNPSHSVAVSLALRQLTSRLPQEWFCRVQSSITLATSEPEPDLAIVLGPERRYANRHPFASDIALVIEVAESTLADDRSEKGMLYAQAAIPEYWIINLVDQCVEVLTNPSGLSDAPAYSQKRDFDSSAALPLIRDGRDCGSIAVSDLLP